MTPDEASAAIGKLLAELDPTTDQVAESVGRFLDNPALPLIMRCHGMAVVIAGAAEGMRVVFQEDGLDAVRKLHLVERTPELVILLRAAADLFEDATKGLRN